MRTPKNLVKHELIGLRCKIVDSTDPGLVGVEGRVVYETKNMLEIEVEGRVKKIPKKNCTFVFFLEDKEVEIPGNKIALRPEDRIKR